MKMMKSNYTLAQVAAIYCVYKCITPYHTVSCCTCGRTIEITSFEDCYAVYGHYIARSKAPKIKYHPANAYPQCPSCNMQISSSIDNAYDNFINFNFGTSFKEQLMQDDTFNDTEYAKNWYLVELSKLAQKYTELNDIFVDIVTGEFKEIEVKENSIEEQWQTFSVTFKQDLDTITNFLKSEPIEYERF